MRELRSVRSLLGPADPARGHNFDVPDYDFTDRADEPSLPVVVRPGRVGKARRSSLAAAGAVALALTGAIGLAVVDPLGTSDAPAFAATPPLIDVEYEDSAPPAAEYLLSIAAQITNAPADGRGPITFVKTRAWALDIALSDSDAVAAVVPYEQELWRAPDRSGLLLRTWLPPQAENERARRDWERTDGPAPARNEVTWYEPGELVTVTREPPSADLAELTAQLYSHQPRENGPKSAIRAATDICEEWVLSAPVRAQLLRFLAGEPELRYRGRVTDRAGREGVAVTAEGDGETDMLILDPHTGSVLAYESIVTRGSSIPVEVPAVFSYVLILESRYVTSMPPQ